MSTKQILPVLFMALTGCASPSETLPAELPTDTATARPTTTQTLPPPTSTPWPTATSTRPPPTPSLDQPVKVRGASFRFRPLQGYQVEMGNSEVIIAPEYGDRFFILSEIPVDPGMPPEFLLGGFTEWAGQLGDTHFEFGEPAITTIGPIEGITAEISGTISQERIHGQVSITKPKANRAFVAYGFVSIQQDRSEWNEIGQHQLNAMLSSVEFDNITSLSSSCPVSTSAKFGIDPSGPIPIGGGRVESILIEQLYLNSIRGPQGETLSFSMLELPPSQTHNLDIFEAIVPGAEEPVRLFMDPFSFAAPVIPAGFTCGPDFPYTIPTLPTPAAGA